MKRNLVWSLTALIGGVVVYASTLLATPANPPLFSSPQMLKATIRRNGPERRRSLQRLVAGEAQDQRAYRSVRRDERVEAWGHYWLAHAPGSQHHHGHRRTTDGVRQ